MNITILNVVKTTEKNKSGGAYQQAEVAFKNNTFGGKVEGKKITSYSKAAFDVLATAGAGDTFDVVVEKNAGGFNEWVSLQKAGATPAVSVPSAGRPAPAPVAAAAGRGFETPEERAKKQVYIVRQSSISSAVAALSVGAKGALKSSDVIAEAKKYEQYVFDLGGPSGFEDIPDLDPSFGQEPQID